MKKKIYTVGSLCQKDYVPSIRLTGKWLQKIGIDKGDKLSLIESQNMIILIKENRKEIKKEKEIKRLELKLKTLKDSK